VSNVSIGKGKRMTELKPCPFCGGEADFISNEYRLPFATHRIFCKECGVATVWYRTKNGVAEDWNRRVKE